MLVGQKETCKVTDFGMARDVQQENIYERKTKVIKKERRRGRYCISFSFTDLSHYSSVKADILPISITKSLDGTLMKILAMRIRV